jgi:choline dehydrogenase-like flavoprotein
MNRRELFKFTLALGTLFGGRRVPTAHAEASRATPAVSSNVARSRTPELNRSERQPSPSSFDAEYVVVGSGAGGGTVAARLAEAGFRVLVLEAGGDPRTLTGGDAQTPNANTLPDDYDVPGFHPLSVENDAMKWDFWVRHYADTTRQSADPKYRERWNGQPVDGVLYPRGGTLGGCTAHNAMILVYPDDSDWNDLADRTGDPSWRADRMRTYFERIENCHHRPFARFLSRLGINPTRHGWGGWLQTEVPVPLAVVKDRNLLTTIFDSIHGAEGAPHEGLADPNEWGNINSGEVGLRYTPLTTRNHQRIGTRERLLEVQRRHPDRLKIETHALATRVIFNNDNRAIGVEYLKGERLYRAHAQPSSTGGEVRQASASREVIVSGGAFNTPQLLMLSGIGPRAALDEHGIPVRVDLPGVGKNLQDRYEVSVVNRMAFKSWDSLDGATYTKNDSQYKEWKDGRSSVYSTNGVLLSLVARSSVDRPVPDLFCYAIIANFFGYFPTYSTLLAQNPNCFTWVILKGHTNNTAGEVTLASADPRDRPRINFHYFEEGSDGSGDDLKAVVEGIKLVRQMTDGLKRQKLITTEELPGETRHTDEQLGQFVRENAWGHHASCTCPIGDQITGGVLTSDFRVHGTEGLRVVDASVFPRIPGLFVVSAVYMIGEKAAEVMIADARRSATRPKGRV